MLALDDDQYILQQVFLYVHTIFFRNSLHWHSEYKFLDIEWNKETMNVNKVGKKDDDFCYNSVECCEDAYESHYDGQASDCAPLIAYRVKRQGSNENNSTAKNIYIVINSSKNKKATTKNSAGKILEYKILDLLASLITHYQMIKKIFRKYAKTFSINNILYYNYN